MGKLKTPIARREAIGSRLRAARKKAGLSVKDVSKRAELSKNHIYVLERGGSMPTDPTIGRLAKLYGVTGASLLYGNGKNGKKNNGE